MRERMDAWIHIHKCSKKMGVRVDTVIINVVTYVIYVRAYIVNSGAYHCDLTIETVDRT